jgi:hypothetical protein
MTDTQCRPDASVPAVWFVQVVPPSADVQMSPFPEVLAVDADVTATRCVPVESDAADLQLRYAVDVLSVRSTQGPPA